MLGGLLLVVCVILQFHYHDSIPWYIWVLALIAQCVAFGEQRCGLPLGKSTECAKVWRCADQAIKALKWELPRPESLLPDYSFSSRSCLASG